MGHCSYPRRKLTSDTQEKKQAKLEGAFDFLDQQKARMEDSIQNHSPDPTPAKQNFSVLAYYIFSEIPPDKKPADTVLETLKNIPIGTTVEEIKRASDAFGVDFNFMKAVAKIESDFNPKQRTGSYIGLFQLSNYEFKQYGSGNITNPRDNAIAAAYKFATEALLFNSQTSKNPTFSDLYLIHQQGWQGAAEHVSHPKRIAWKSMCATDEGREKGERWCKRAIWGNTLPAIKHIWSSVDRLTSAAFVGCGNNGLTTSIRAIRWRLARAHRRAPISSIARHAAATARARRTGDRVRGEYPLLPLGRHFPRVSECPLLEAKRTSLRALSETHPYALLTFLIIAFVGDLTAKVRRQERRVFRAMLAAGRTRAAPDPCRRMVWWIWARCVAHSRG